MPNLKGTTVTWLGHATVLVKTDSGTTILIDPFLEHNPKFPKDFPLPEKLDLILATHGHFDHIADAVPQAKRTGASVVAQPEVTAWFGSKGVEKLLGVGIGGSLKFKDVTISMTDACHSSSITDGDQTIYGGVASGFVIAVDNGPVLYHAGDTGVFSGMELIRELYAPEFGMLPIGGNYTMDPRGAAVATRLLDLKTVLPIHWGTMPVLTGTPEEFEKHVGKTGVEILKAQPGEEIK